MLWKLICKYIDTNVIMIGKHICTNVNDTKKSLKLFSELPKTNSTRINKEL